MAKKNMDEVKRLIDNIKEKGPLNFDEVNDILPDFDFIVAPASARLAQNADVTILLSTPKIQADTDFILLAA